VLSLLRSAAVAAALATVAAGRAPAAGVGSTVAFEWPAMGTRVRLLVRGGEEAGAAMRDAARAAFEAVEAETSAFRATSAVARVSAAAGDGEWIPAGEDFGCALGIALDVARESGGAFNPLVAPLLERHGFSRRPQAAATGSETAGDLLALLDLAKIERRPDACRLAEAGMALDLGGVAKGVGADRAFAAARAAATNEFLLDAGGMLLGLGAWTVGLRDPRAPADAPPLDAFPLPAGRAIATSGNYERFAVRADGTRVGHLFDPRTGRPAESDVLQVTVLAPTAALADAWSTALFVLGPEEGRKALAGRRDVDALWLLAAPSNGIRRVAR